MLDSSFQMISPRSTKRLLIYKGGLEAESAQIQRKSGYEDAKDTTNARDEYALYILVTG
jgi:hypothetical protein